MTKEVEKISACLLGGGVVLLPTDTVYGLAVCPRFPEAVDRLYALKQRPGNLNIPVMVARAEGLRSLGLDINDRAGKLLRSSFIPGALTLAMGFARGPRVAWLAGREEVAVRIPDDARMLAVLEKTGPLLVTSANRHGRPTPESCPEILRQLEGRPDMAIDIGNLRTVPSTLVNCRYDPPVVEREGVISRLALEAVFEADP